MEPPPPGRRRHETGGRAEPRSGACQRDLNDLREHCGCYLGRSHDDVDDSRLDGIVDRRRYDHDWERNSCRHAIRNRSRRRRRLAQRDERDRPVRRSAQGLQRVRDSGGLLPYISKQGLEPNNVQLLPIRRRHCYR